MSWSANVVDKCEAAGDKAANEPGAKRVLNDAFHETLQSLNEESKTLTYSIDSGPSPVSQDDVNNYRGKVQVRPVTEGGGTFVEWSSEWQGEKSETGEFCHNIYVGLLNDLKQHFN